MSKNAVSVMRKDVLLDALIAFYRIFPWPKERGKYFFKNYVVQPLVRNKGLVLAGTAWGRFVLRPGKDALQSMLFFSGRHYERTVEEFLEKLLRPDSVVFDIGAHAGYYTLLFSRRCGAGGKVFAFEPQRELCGQLRQSLKINAAENVTLEEMALADREEALTLHQHEDQGLSSLSAAGIFPGRVENFSVPGMRFDVYVREKKIRAVDLVKMDTEGGEWVILKGMSETLARSDAPDLLIEMHPAQIRGLGGSQLEILQNLSANGYSLFEIHPRLGVRDCAIDPPEGCSAWHIFASKNPSRVKGLH